MGGRTSKSDDKPCLTPRQLIERAAQTVDDDIKAAKLSKIIGSLETKLTSGVKYDEWRNTYVAEDPEKARKIILAAVNEAEKIQDDILAAVEGGVLKIGVSYNKFFYVLISYIMQYTETDLHGQFIRRFKIEFEIPKFELPYTVDEAIRLFPDESVVNDRVVVRDDYLGYHLPRHMMKVREAYQINKLTTSFFY